MASTIVNPHDKMRSRDVNKVARGEQAPRPAHEPGSVADSPPPPPDGATIQLRTAPCDFRFPTQNQTRHCYVRYLEYHLCMKAKEGDKSECEKFQRYYRSLCPMDWPTDIVARKELDKPPVARFQSKRRRRKTQSQKNLKNVEKAKLAKYPTPIIPALLCPPYGLTHHTRNVSCRLHRHGHVLGQLPGLPRSPRRQAARLVRAALAPAQHPAAVRATSNTTTAAAHAIPGAAAGCAGEGAEARGAVRGLHGLGGVVADTAVRDWRRSGVGRVPGLRRRVGAAQDPLRGRAAAGQHQGCGGGEGGRPAQWNSVHRDAGGRRRHAAAGRPGGARPAGAGGRQRRGVRGHLRRRQEAAGARHGLQALHEGDVRGHRVRAAVHAERRQAAGSRPGEPGLRRGRRRLRGRALAGASRGDAGVRRAGR